MSARLAVVATALILLAPVTAHGFGELALKPFPGGCISFDSTGGTCQTGPALLGGEDMVISPDGKNLYVSNNVNDGVTTIDVNTATGGMAPKPSQAGCTTLTGSSGACKTGVAIDYVNDVAISSDGKNVYTASFHSAAVAVFDRDAVTGELTQKSAGNTACISNTGGGGCETGHAMPYPSAVAVSSDGKSVYAVNSQSGGSSVNSVAIYDRDTAGVLTQKAGTAGCFAETTVGGLCQSYAALSGLPNDVTVSPDGKNVYVARISSPYGIAVFDRAADGTLTPASCHSFDGSGGTCFTARGVIGTYEVEVSPDGKQLYAGSLSAVAVFDRSTSGALTQKAGGAGCLVDNPNPGTCTKARGLNLYERLTVSPDGRTLYALAAAGIALFDRDTGTGALTQKSGQAGCITESGDSGECTDGTATGSARAGAVSPDNDDLYVRGGNNVVAYGRSLVDPPSGDGGGSGGGGGSSTGGGTTTTTTTTTTPAVTTPARRPATPSTRPAASGGRLALTDVVRGLPSTRRCVSRRRFRIRLRHPRGAKIVSAVVVVSGRLVTTRRGKRVTAPVDLRGLPKGRFTVRIAIVLDDGRVVAGTRRYRTCAPKRGKSRRPRV